MESDLCEEFRQEAQELLADMEAALLDLESTPNDPGLINRVFRDLHTIKGTSGMFGLEEASSFAHHVENACDRVRSGETACTPELIAAILSAQDHLRTLLTIPETPNVGVCKKILDLLRKESAQGNQQGLPEKMEAPMKTWRIRFQLPPDFMTRGSDPLIFLDELRALGSATVTPLTDGVPDLETFDPSILYLGWELVLETAQPRQAIDDIFVLVLAEMVLEVEEIGENETLPNSNDQSASEETAPQILEAQNQNEPANSGKRSSTKAQPSQTANKNAPTEHSIRVPAKRLDELMNRVGELVIAQSRLRQVANNTQDQQVQSVAEEIERLMLELRDTSMDIRMVPIGQLFGRYRRVVHDIARDLGKQVELVMSGEETELDKTVIEQLNDPLVHLIRNAIDHGLEAPEKRVETGKREVGLISLSARHAGTEVLVTITDDGRGMDREQIRVKAEERGLIAPDDVLSDNELFQVLLLPGFSTAKEVTSLSGRGVGMDVVKRTIEELRGKIDISSTPSRGTQITLRLPLTLAIIDGLVVRVGDGRYVVPLEAVEECVELTAEDDARSRGRSFLNIRGDLVPFLRLRELFALQTPPGEYQKVVLSSSGDLKVGFVVDQVIGDHQTVIKSLSKLHQNIGLFSGATILGDGTVALILDTQHLIEYGQNQEENLKNAG
jgi:two-component system chemotaxis sensor kinase CheA